MSTRARNVILSCEYPMHQFYPPFASAKPSNDAASKDDLIALMQTVRQGFTLPKIDPITFDGNPENYHSFMQGFDNMIDKHPYPSDVKLSQLVQM